MRQIPAGQLKVGDRFCDPQRIEEVLTVQEVKLVPPNTIDVRHDAQYGPHWFYFSRTTPVFLPEDGADGLDSVNEYQRLAMRTLAVAVQQNDAALWLDPRSGMRWNAASGMASEAGEINEIYKKLYFHGHPFDEACATHLKKEYGDLLWYVMLGLFAEGWDPAEITALNIAKLKARYPEGFSTERSMHRAPGDV